MNEATIKLTVHQGHQWFDRIAEHTRITKDVLAPSLGLSLNGIDATLVVANAHFDIDCVTGARIIVEGRLR